MLTFMKQQMKTDKYFYSNCLFEAVRHWIRHPFKTKLICIPPEYNGAGIIHFFWCTPDGDFDFTSEKKLRSYLLYKGHIRKKIPGFAARYKRVVKNILKRERGNNNEH